MRRNAGANQGNMLGPAIYADGDVFEGAWKQNAKHGHGVYMFASGDVFEGEFRLGKRHGWGGP